MIPYGRQSISEGDISAVVAVLRSEFLTQGPIVPQFEEGVAGIVGAAHAVAVNSATSALHIACLALDVGPGDAVWTSPNSFVASANCALYCGATVDFVDIDSNTFCMSEAALAEKLAAHRRSNRPLPKVVIPVHFGGQSCNMADIHALAMEYGFKIIEDASHAIGGQYNPHTISKVPSGPIGNCQFSDICVFSFHPVKIITTGEGGMAVTQSASLAERMRQLRSHGITRDPAQMTEPSHGPWYYQMRALGLNYRLTDIAAALGLHQLQRLEDFVRTRQSIADRYDKAFQGRSGIDLQTVPTYTESSRHLYVVRVDEDRHRLIFDTLRAEGIGVNLHYIPIHLQPYYRALGFAPGDFPVAEQYYREAISLPIFPGLSEADRGFVIDRLITAVTAPA
jgi:UDP-4-amino-4,6-dideoxy-N-acetyl-beta-L-altrosamine transaminase